MVIDPQQQKIMGYFIEEAREHLETIFNGLNNFAVTIADPDAIHEMYRAAHSIKGGAAMLGVESVRLIAYYLEDYFKKIRDFPELQVDQKLVDLFLEAYAYLPQLLNQLEKHYEVPQAVSEAAVEASAITLEKLAEHFETLLTAEPSASEPTSTSDPYTQFGAVVQAILGQMSTFLSYTRTEEATDSLLKLCDELLQWGDYLQVEVWNGLVTLVKQVIANPFNSFEAIAPILSHDLHTACDLVITKCEGEIFPSSALQELLAPPVYNDQEDEQTSNIFSSVPLAEEDPDTDVLVHNPYVAQPSAEMDEPEIDWTAGETAESPRIGAPEMETLANLFEQKDIDMAAAWEDMESNDTQIMIRAGYGVSEDLMDTVVQPEEDITDFLQNLADTGSASDTEDIDSLLAEMTEDTTSDLDNILSAIDGGGNRSDSDTLLDSLMRDAEENSSPSSTPETDPLQLDDFLVEPEQVNDAPAPAINNQTLADYLEGYYTQQQADVASITDVSLADPHDSHDREESDDFGALGLGEFFVEETAPEPELSDFFANESSEEDDVTYFQVDEIEPKAVQPTLLATDTKPEEDLAENWAKEQGAIADVEFNFFEPELSYTEVSAQSTEELADFFDGDLGSMDDSDQWSANILVSETTEAGGNIFSSANLDYQTNLESGDSPPDTGEGIFTDLDVDNLGQSPQESTAEAVLFADLFDEIGTNNQEATVEAGEDIFSSVDVDYQTDSEIAGDASPLDEIDTDTGEDIFSGLDVVYEGNDSIATDNSPLSNLLDEIGTAAGTVPQFGSDDDFLSELNLPPLTDSAVAVSVSSSTSELDELSQFFEFGDAPLEAEPPLAIDVDNESVPLADVAVDIPDLTDLEMLIGSPVIADSATEFADLEALIDISATAIAVEEPAQDNFTELEAMLGIDTPTHANGNSNGMAIEMEPASEPMVKPNNFSALEGLLGANSEKGVGTITTSPVAKPTPAKASQRLASSSVRVDVKYLDSLNNLVGELVVNRNLLDQDQERLQNYMYTLQQRVQQLGDVSQRMRDQYDRSLLETSLMVGRSRNQSFSQMGMDGGAQTIAADFEAIEFDRYNAFHILSQEIIELIVRIKESAADLEFVVAETEQVTRELGRIATQVQDDLKQSRMVPFANLADRLPRGVRDRAVKSGKQAELVVVGRETLVDKSILEQLSAPMTHLVNNAVDHGLEPPEVRRQAGKPPQGTIEVRAFHQGNQTVITVRDDGGGINPERVKQKAVEKGLKTPAEVERMTDEEAYELLFLAGFSTRSQADEFAGRGVGLDVVKTCLDEIKGSIMIQSEVGKGTQFTIRLPLTLSISKAIFCAVDNARIAIPLDGFEDMVEIPQSQVILNNIGQTCIPWREMLLPFQPMSSLLQFNRQLGRTYTKQEADEICVIILRDSDNNYLGLKVDQFLGEHEIVVKQLEGPVPKPPGIAGATVLGDGRVISIVNVLELFDIANGRLRLNTVQQIPVDIDTPEETQPTVLIVDDSITVRELLSMTFSKVGYHVEQARDGQDALDRLRGGLPCDLIFCDIEMPRMDGMELLSRLQKDEVLRKIPMAMLTSRGADKHRQRAIELGAKAYFTKPYLEEELLTASQRLLKGEILV